MTVVREDATREKRSSEPQAADEAEETWEEAEVTEMPP